MGQLEERSVLDDELSKSNAWEYVYYWAIVSLGGFLFLLSCALFPHFWQVNGWDLLMFLILNIIAEQTYVVLPHGSKLSASFAIILAVMVLFSPPVAAFLAIMGALIAIGILQRRGWRVASFNAGQYAITYVLAGLAMNTTQHYLHPVMLQNPMLDSLISAGAASAIYLLINLPLVNGYLAIKQQPKITLKQWVQRLIVIKEDRIEIFQTLFFYPIAVMVAYSYQQEHNPIIPVVLAFLVFGGLRFIEQRRRIERQSEKMQVLYQLTKLMGESVLQEADVELSGSHVFDHLFSSDNTSIRRLITNQRTSVYRVEQLGEDRRIVHEKSDSLREPEKIYHMDEQGILQRIVQQKEGVVLSQLSNLGKSYTTWRITYQYLVAQPVLVDDEVAYILVMFRTAGEPFQQRDVRMLKLLVNAFEITLKNVQLRNRIQAQAIKDGLMGIFNHRYMKVKLEEEMARGKRYDSPLSLIIADVDYFKKFNDTHGHLLGDKVLKEIADILMDSVRETDIVARYGGEELAILLPETPLEAACEVAERIRRNVANHVFRGKEQQQVSLSMSIGVSCLDDEPELEPSELIIRTDTALYRAKHQGRNQICKSVLDKGRLIIETYSRGASPQVDQAQAHSHLRPELLHTWTDQLDRNLAELEQKLQTAIRQANLGAGVERFFEKRLQPAIPKLLNLMPRTQLSEEGTLAPETELSQLLRQLQKSFSRRLQHKKHLNLLQTILLNTYRYFIYQTLELNAQEGERKQVLRHSCDIILYVEEQLFGASLEGVQQQISHSRNQQEFSRQLLQVLRQNDQPQSAETELLRLFQKAIPQSQYLFLACPGQGEELYPEAWLPQDATPLQLSLVLQDQQKLQPKQDPVILELNLAEAFDYLEITGDLPDFPTETGFILIPLWLEEELMGLLGLLLPAGKQLSQLQRHWLKSTTRSLAETLKLLQTLEDFRYQPIRTLRTVVDVVQAARGSFEAETLANLATRLGQKTGLSRTDLQHLRDAAYLHQLGHLLAADKSGHKHGQEAQLLNQRFLNTLNLNNLDKPLRHVRERWDGNGLPDGLSGQRIPLSARILGLSQAYLARLQPEPNKGQDKARLVEELSQTGYYDPKLCTYLKDLIRENAF